MGRSQPHGIDEMADEQIKFAHIAHEWRMKYAENELKGGAVAVDKILADHIAEIKCIDGFVSVQRAVCGGCNDFKVVIKLEAPKFGAWEAAGFPPETVFKLKAEAVEGITSFETQNYTFEEL